MRALCWYGKRDLRVMEVPDPALVNPHDAIVKVELAAICGSDLHLYNGYIPGMQKGDILGHEFMGEIVDVGAGVETLAPGDRVVATCLIACGQCWFCTHHLYAACDNSLPAQHAEALEQLYGHAGAGLFGYSHLFGGFAGGQAEYVRVPYADVNCLQVPPHIDAERVLFLGDILPTGWMAAENCDITPGDVVAVFGCGPVGQLAILSAYAMGAERVIAIDSVEARLEMARDQGAEVIDEAEHDVLPRLDDLTGGRGPDACIDAVGLEAHDGLMGTYDVVKQQLRLQSDRPGALRMAIRACRKAGRVSIPGVYGGLIDKVPMGAAFGKGLTFRMGQTHFHRYTAALYERIETGEIDPSFIITHHVPLEAAPSAYEIFSEKADGCIKVVVTP